MEILWVNADQNFQKKKYENLAIKFDKILFFHSQKQKAVSIYLISEKRKERLNIGDILLE